MNRAQMPASDALAHHGPRVRGSAAPRETVDRSTSPLIPIRIIRDRAQFAHGGGDFAVVGVR